MIRAWMFWFIPLWLMSMMPVADWLAETRGRRAVAWPELYDEMCAVAAREEYQGMGYEQLRDVGIGNLALGGGQFLK